MSEFLLQDAPILKCSVGSEAVVLVRFEGPARLEASDGSELATLHPAESLLPRKTRGGLT